MWMYSVSFYMFLHIHVLCTQIPEQLTVLVVLLDNKLIETQCTNYHLLICKNWPVGQSQEPAETRPRSNFPESRIGFPRHNQLS